MMAVTALRADVLFERVEAADTRLFFTNAPIEYGKVGGQARPIGSKPK